MLRPADAGRARDDPPVGPRGQQARRPLRGQLAAHARAHQELLRPRGGGRAPAGRDDPLRPRRRRGTNCCWCRRSSPTSACTVALEAARRARAPIAVAGSGPDHEALAGAYPEARFLGRVGDEELARLYASARAVLVPAMEEFGITAVEAQAAGRPGDRRAGRGRAGDRGRGPHRAAGWSSTTSRTSAGRSNGSRSCRSTPRTRWPTPQRFSVAAFRRAMQAELQKALEQGPRPRQGRRRRVKRVAR